MELLKTKQAMDEGKAALTVGAADLARTRRGRRAVRERRWRGRGQLLQCQRPLASRALRTHRLGYAALARRLRLLYHATLLQYTSITSSLTALFETQAVQSEMSKSARVGIIIRKYNNSFCFLHYGLS